MSTVPAGHAVVRPFSGRGSFLLHRRAAAVALCLALVLAAACVAYLCVGESFVAPAEVVKVLLGQDSPTSWSSARCGCPG